MTNFLSLLTPRSPEKEAAWRDLMKTDAQSYAQEIVGAARIFLEAKQGLSDAKTCIEGLCQAHSQDPIFMHLSIENTNLKEKLSVATVTSIYLQIIAHLQKVNDALDAEAPPPEDSLLGDLSSRIPSMYSSEASFSDGLDAEVPPPTEDNFPGDLSSRMPSRSPSEASFYSTEQPPGTAKKV